MSASPVCCDAQVQELAELLRGVSQRLTDGERSWESEKRGLEGQLNRNLHSLRELQATADQLRSASRHFEKRLCRSVVDQASHLLKQSRSEWKCGLGITLRPCQHVLLCVRSRSVVAVWSCWCSNTC